jgi:succinoglycan biosynthesis transport protein ExoP
MDRNMPPVEPLPRFTGHPTEGIESQWRQSTRAKLFAITFILTFIIGVGWTLLQPTIYRSSATVLMSAPSAIDATAQVSNVQSVAIQRRILLGGEVTQRLLSELDKAVLTDIDIHYLRTVMQVNPVPETNLVEMAAQGGDAEVLPGLVNTWIEVYIEIRANAVQQNQQKTLQVVEAQLNGITSQVAAARATLAVYRADNNITSTERQENEELARLDGLNTALNTAIESEVNTRAKLESLRSAIAKGDNVVPPSDRESVEDMYTELIRLNATLNKLAKNYTMDFIRRNPKWRDIPDRIEELEMELAEVLDEGQALLMGETQRAHSVALQTVENLQQKLEAQEAIAAKFTTIYATHEAMMEDLETLEALNRQTQARLTEIQVNQVEKYPQVSVIDRPGEESIRVGPDLWLWLAGSLASALGMGVLSVWLYGFLGPRQAQPAFVTLSGVHMYPQEVPNQLAYSTQPTPEIGHMDTNLLERNETADDHDSTEGNSAEEEDNSQENPADKKP